MSDSGKKKAPDALAAKELLPLVYDELRMIARRRMSGEATGQTLDPTSLVHEAYLKLAGGDETRKWNDRKHFLLAAAEAMRRILIDRARARGAAKRGGGARRISDIDVVQLAGEEVPEHVLALEESLGRLAAIAPEKVELVKLKYFGGLKLAEAAELLEISPATADRHWAYAKAWLLDDMRRQEAGPETP